MDHQVPGVRTPAMSTAHLANAADVCIRYVPQMFGIHILCREGRWFNLRFALDQMRLCQGQSEGWHNRGGSQEDL